MNLLQIPAAAPRALALLILIFAIAASPMRADGPSPAAVKAFDNYTAAAESHTREDLAAGGNFLYIDTLPQPERAKNYALLRHGQTLVHNSAKCPAPPCTIPGGLIHDWTAIVFVPGVTLAQTLATLQDYDRDAIYYQPQVIASKILDRSGNRFQVFLRLQQTHILTVVLDTEYEIQYAAIDDTHAASQSHSTRISEVENPDSARERVLPAGNDHGFLWRLNSYWRFYQADGGVYIQCSAISLTRDVPAGLGWLVGPFIQNIPRESLLFTLTATRQALLQKFRTGTASPTNHSSKGDPQ